ncbi:MAG: AraC family transcriptional regulator [Prolixibacteraceae bacterium]|jgi:AraC-like DNA-binding protein|nr:AraC family transcriptional regulator [Prolixibacteraceae bacterium]
MKPFYAKTATDSDNAINIRHDEMIRFYPHWHYHNEYELVYIHKSSGIRYVGDSINPYSEGDLVLLGSRLPHIWVNDIKDLNTSENQAVSTVIHFQREFVHHVFFNLSLMENIRNLFQLSARGVRFINFQKTEQRLINIQNSQATDKVILTLALLNQLCKHTRIELLSSKEYHLVTDNQNIDRLSKVHDYIVQHFKEKITLENLASVALMTPQAFCNYFKNKTLKTVFTYINDLKIGYSRKLLIETDLNVDQIAFESGFNSTTFYNRKFKEKIQMTPKEYRKRFKLEEKVKF